MSRDNESDNGEFLRLPAKEELPNKLYIIPIGGRPIFPGIFTPLMINNTEDTKVVEEAFKGDQYIGIVMLKDDVDTPSISDLYSVGTVARIIKKINLPDGGVNVFVSTIQRFKIRKALNASGPMVAAVDYLEDIEDNPFEIKALTRAIVSEMKEISDNNPMFTEEMRLNMVNIDHPGKIADFVASILNIEKDEQQKVLEILNVRERMNQVLVYIKKEEEILRVQKKIQTEINDKVEKNQRDYFLREELKSIQEELGIASNSKTSDYQKFKAKIESFHFTGEIKEALEGELEKFNLTDPHDPDYMSSRNYLELVCALPWNDKPVESYSLEEAKKILDGDHYGLEDVKKRILEYLSVRKLKHDGKGSVLILVGPPGVGKTSVGHSIAKAMRKPFFRFSVGGEHDEAKIKGFRRTYISSMPGQIISGLKITKSKAPVFMIDEVDKMNASAQGDPSAALLEVLDPEQNTNFRDSYLDLPFDLSNVFFILTANTLDSIPQPLLDRAEIIELSGYIDQEKMEIAKKYLIPKNLEKNGLKKASVKYSKEALALIATEYAREAGVRNYEKCIDKINRKLIHEKVSEYEKDNPLEVLPTAEEFRKSEEKKLDGKRKKIEEQFAQGAITESDRKERMEAQVDKLLREREEEFSKKLEARADEEAGKIRAAFEGKSWTIGEKEVRTYLGKAVFDESQIKRASVPGTAIGLAWTSMGGDTLLLESISFASDKGGLQLTGQMGDVMKESAQIAMNWAKQYSIAGGYKEGKWFEENCIHLHIPEGATKKDGPSAGITMATTFVSLLRGKKIKANLAMTGELSLTGQVLPIGGLREKTVAAKRNKIKTIIIPKANERDLEDIPAHVKEGLKFIPVSRAEEVMQLVF
ncbi:MAG: endopeptidase La [Treponema sp.]|nr:endopeptidase La [Treponema sp.]